MSFISFTTECERDTDLVALYKYGHLALYDVKGLWASQLPYQDETPVMLLNDKITTEDALMLSKYFVNVYGVTPQPTLPARAFAQASVVAGPMFERRMFVRNGYFVNRYLGNGSGPGQYDTFGVWWSGDKPVRPDDAPVVYASDPIKEGRFEGRREATIVLNKFLAERKAYNDKFSYLICDHINAIADHSELCSMCGREMKAWL